MKSSRNRVGAGASGECRAAGDGERGSEADVDITFQAIIMEIMRRRHKKYVEYRVVIAPDVRTGSGEQGFTAFVPALGIATDGDTVEEARENIQNMIAFHLECLRREKQPLPVEQPAADFITTARVAVPA